MVVSTQSTWGLRQASMVNALTPVQYDIIYNCTSLGLASMMASTVFFFLRIQSFHERYRAALCFTGLVTFIAAYHYFRIFNSFVEAYTPREVVDGVVNPHKCDADTFGYSPTGHAFNDAYRYVDWFLSMIPFCYIVYTLFVGLKASQEAQPEACKEQVKWACWATVISWCTYPIVFILPMLSGSSGKSGLGAQAMVMIQVGYTASDIISKCGVGYLVYRIGLAKSTMESDKNAGYGEVEPDTPREAGV